MSGIVRLFNVNRVLSTIIVLIVGIVVGFAIWNLVNVVSHPDGIFAPPKPFKVAAAGDWGCGVDADRTVTNIASKDPQVVLALGDLSYQGSTFGHVCDNTYKWFNMMRPIDKNLFMVVGNHDIDAPGLLDEYDKHFGLCPVRKSSPHVVIPFSNETRACNHFYSFNSHGVHFLILNSEEDWGEDSTQYLFTDQDLKIASSDPNTDWIIVAYHSARYASIDYYTRLWIFGPDYAEKSKEFLDRYHPLFDKYGVDLVLQGHVHNYQRTYPLKYDSDKKLPIRTSLGINNYKHLDGQIYLTVGTAGVGLGDVKPTNHFISDVMGITGHIDSYYVVKADSSHYGFLELEFNPDRSSLDGNFIGNDATKGSIVLDHFTISK